MYSNGLNVPLTLAFGVADWQTSHPGDREEQILAILRKYGIKEIDTARIYGGGKSEECIGSTGIQSEFTITTKAPCGYAPGKATKQGILEDLKASLDALKTDKLGVYYLHFPSADTPIEETLEAVQEAYLQGKFEKFGLSNFSKDETLAVYNHAKAKGYVLPTMYQMNYSAIARKNEAEVIPTLRQLGIKINAYSPIAGGFLTKTVADFSAADKSGRWGSEAGVIALIYNKMYNQPGHLKFLAKWEELAKETGLTKVAMAYRWVVYHGALKAEYGDGIVIGASRPEQLEKTLEILKEGPLPEEVAKRIDALWDLAKDESYTDNWEAGKAVLSEMKK